MNAPFRIPVVTAAHSVMYDDTLRGLVDLYLVLDQTAQSAHMPDDIMDTFSDLRAALRAEITRRPIVDEVDVSAKLRMAAHLFADPGCVWSDDAVLLQDAVVHFRILRADWIRRATA